MFGWKRQRKDEETAAAAAAACPPLGTSPAAVVSAAPASAASSVCSDLDDALAVGTPSSSGPCLLSASSIELATTGRQALEHGSVRSKAAYFEALCHANTTMHIQCSSEDGAQQCGRPSREPRISRQLQHGAFPDADMAHADSDEEAAGEWQDFSEVHLLLRMPRSHAAREQPTPSSSSKYGSIAEMEDLIERLQEALELKEGQHKAAVDAFRRRVSRQPVGTGHRPPVLPAFWLMHGRMQHAPSNDLATSLAPCLPTPLLIGHSCVRPPALLPPLCCCCRAVGGVRELADGGA